MEVRRYQTVDGRRPIVEWLDGLRDAAGRGRITARLERLNAGLLGDWKAIGDGLCELRIDTGPGYRVYYATDGNAIILLYGGDKSTQVRDIERAYGYWKDYKTRT